MSELSHQDTTIILRQIDKSVRKKKKIFPGSLRYNILGSSLVCSNQVSFKSIQSFLLDPVDNPTSQQTGENTTSLVTVMINVKTGFINVMDVFSGEVISQ